MLIHVSKRGPKPSACRDSADHEAGVIFFNMHRRSQINVLLTFCYVQNWRRICQPKRKFWANEILPDFIINGFGTDFFYIVRGSFFITRNVSSLTYTCLHVSAMHAKIVPLSTSFSNTLYVNEWINIYTYYLFRKAWRTSSYIPHLWRFYVLRIDYCSKVLIKAFIYHICVTLR